VSVSFAGRLARLGERAGERGFAAVVVSPSPDLAYLTGYSPMPFERPTLLVVRPGLDPAMLVPELEEAPARSSPGGALLEVVTWSDGSDPYAAAAQILPASGTIAAGDRMWAAHLLGLQQALPGAIFQAASPLIGELRSVKDAGELDALRRAGGAADATFRELCRLSFLGRTEAEVASDVADLLVSNGHTRADFTIVASGPNSASPHHEPGQRRFEARDAVVLDFGGELDSYFSDTTRTVAVGEPPEGFDEIYGAVEGAQEAAFGAIHPGVPAEQIDRAARSVIEEAGFGDRFIHRTGHGIGLEVHEPPYIVEGNAAAVVAGNTFSIEPGVYVSGRYGVRIEDIVAVTADGAERFNLSTRELQVVE
jgi:Xaa-Pro aminopeptidase